VIDIESDSEWVVRGFPTIALLLVYGVGLGLPGEDLTWPDLRPNRVLAETRAQ
jgi:hypothetical protein